MKVHYDSRFYKVSFFAYIKLYYQQNSVSTVLVNWKNFARLSFIAGENMKNNFFSVTGCKIRILSIFEKIFLIRVTNKSVVDTALNPNCKVPTVCLYSVIGNLFFLQVCKALFVRTREIYTK